MPVSGMLMVPGVRAEVTFYKGLLDKLGLKFDALQMGKYKGAAEPFSRDKHERPVAREPAIHRRRPLRRHDRHGRQGRHLQDYQVNSLVDRGLFSAAAAKEAGLINEVLYADQFEECWASGSRWPRSTWRPPTSRSRWTPISPALAAS